MRNKIIFLSIIVFLFVQCINQQNNICVKRIQLGGLYYDYDTVNLKLNNKTIFTKAFDRTERGWFLFDSIYYNVCDTSNIFKLSLTVNNLDTSFYFDVLKDSILYIGTWGPKRKLIVKPNYIPPGEG